MNENIEFGVINLETKTFHRGFIDSDGEMAYKHKGEPVSEKTIRGISPPKPDIDPVINESSWMSGPRWAGIKNFLRKTAVEFDVKITIDEDQGWINTVVYYTLAGRKSKIDQMEGAVRAAVEDYKRK